MSIGLSVSATGQKLRTVLVTKGKTAKSLSKYGDYRNDPRCLLTYTPSGWFTEEPICKVLDIIHEHAQGLPSLCIWDSYRAHQTEKVLLRAKDLGIQLLEIPKGLTWALQPLDVKVNGPYKQMMNSHWLKHKYNENDVHCHSNLCQTILSCYDDLKNELISEAFKCLF
jgi:hypothetical protein